jgi:DNA-binding transcriptional LysR family regulator
VLRPICVDGDFDRDERSNRRAGAIVAWKRNEAAMELRHLRYFVAVAEELHFGRAAERLHIAQSALSTQIQALERRLGARLLQRSRRSSVALTDAGALVLEEARLTLRQAERTELVGRRAGRGELGRVEIGYVASAAFAGLLSSTVSAYRRDHPVVDIRVREMETPRQLEDLAAGRLDVGFLRPRPRYPPGIAVVRLLREPLMIALPQDHPLAMGGEQALRAAALAKEGFVAPQFDEEAAGFQEHIAKIGRHGRFAPRIAHRVHGFVTAASLVGAGLGVAAVPASLQCLRLPGVVYRPLADVAVPVDLAAAFRRDERAPAARSLIEQIRRATTAPPAEPGATT